MKTRIGVALMTWVIISMATPAYPQYDGEASHKIPPDLLRSDFLQLRDSLQKLHPGLYRYRTRQEMDHMFDSCLSVIRDSMSITDFYGLACFAIASMGDGHTNCRLSGPVLRAYLNNTKVFPAMVLFIHDRAFIFCCKQRPELDKSEILSIDHRPMAEIVQKLYSYIQSDAFIRSRKNWELPENFQLLYNIAFGVKDSYAIDIRTDKGEERSIRLRSDTLRNFLCNPPFTRPEKYLWLRYRPGGLAVLNIGTFFNGFLQGTGENFQNFLDSAFRDIRSKKAEKLLIDIRRNQGGNDENGAILYSYLTSKPFRYYENLETVRRKLSVHDHPMLSLQEPNANSFSGKVFILMDGRSFSASAEFSSIVRTNDRGKFIGEECGGGYYGNTSGDDRSMTLPNSQISVRIPLVKYIIAVRPLANNIRGIEPEYPVFSTIGDIVERQDGQLEAAIRIAGK